MTKPVSTLTLATVLKSFRGRNVVLTITWPRDWAKNLEFNPLNAKFNPICHLLTLLRAHHILHVSRMRVKTAVPN
jgi:hypothetical protein